MNLYQIKDTLSHQERALFTIPEIARIIGVQKKIATIYVQRMLKKKLVFHIERNKVSTTDDPFVIASQLIMPCYISLTTALYLHGAIGQVINNIFLLTSRQRRAITIFGMEASFIKTRPPMMFGYKKVAKGSSFIMLAELEKAIIDCLYFPRYCPLTYTLEALKKADIEKIQRYATLVKKEVVIRRLGYLLDVLGVPHALKRTTKTPYKLNPVQERRGTFNTKWYLYINEEV